MDVKVTIHRTTLSALLADGGTSLRLGLILHYAGARIVTTEFPEREVFLLRFGRIFRGKDGMSAYEEAVAGGFDGTRDEFRHRLANLKDMDDKPTENSDNAVSSGGVYEALEEINVRWNKVL